MYSYLEPLSVEVQSDKETFMHATVSEENKLMEMAHESSFTDSQVTSTSEDNSKHLQNGPECSTDYANGEIVYAECPCIPQNSGNLPRNEDNMESITVYAENESSCPAISSNELPTSNETFSEEVLSEHTTYNNDDLCNDNSVLYREPGDSCPTNYALQTFQNNSPDENQDTYGKRPSYSTQDENIGVQQASGNVTHGHNATSIPTPRDETPQLGRTDQPDRDMYMEIENVCPRNSVIQNDSSLTQTATETGSNQFSEYQSTYGQYPSNSPGTSIAVINIADAEMPGLDIEQSVNDEENYDQLKSTYDDTESSYYDSASHYAQIIDNWRQRKWAELKDKFTSSSLSEKWRNLKANLMKCMNTKLFGIAFIIIITVGSFLLGRITCATPVCTTPTELMQGTCNKNWTDFKGKMPLRALYLYLP